MANLAQLSLFVSPDRCVHIGDDGGMSTLCERPKSNLLPVEDQDFGDDEICEKCLVWARDLSLTD